MEYTIKRTRYIKEIIHHLLFLIIGIGIIFFLSAMEGMYINSENYMFFIILSLLILVLTVIYPVSVIRNYYVHDKNVIIKIDDNSKIFTYKKNDIYLDFSFSDIEAVYRIESKYIHFIPFYYELNLKNGNIVYASFLLIEKFPKDLGAKILVYSQFNMYLPNK